MRHHTGKMNFYYLGRQIEAEFSGCCGSTDHCEYMRYVDTHEDVPEDVWLAIDELYSKEIEEQYLKVEAENEI